MFGCVYVATNTYNGKQYVGLTRLGIDVRWSQHIQKSRNPKTYFHRAIFKYGSEAFKIVPYASAVSLDTLSTLEKTIIMQLLPAYNQTNGGEVTLGRKYDDATKERIRQSNIGKKRTPEQCKRIGEIKKQQLLTRTDLYEKVCAALKKGRESPGAEQRRIKQVRKAAKNRIWTETSRKKLSESCKGRKYGPEIIAKITLAKRKPIKCSNTGAVYSCAEEAAKACGVSRTSVFRVCHGKLPSVKGLTFSFLE